VAEGIGQAEPGVEDANEELGGAEEVDDAPGGEMVDEGSAKFIPVVVVIMVGGRRGVVGGITTRLR